MTTAESEAMQSRTVDIGGLRVRWEELGRGQPIVFIHGIPTGPALWRHVVKLLPHHRVLVWEMVGYGRSMKEGRGRDISLSSQADYLKEWMDAIDVRQAVLVGHDIGGGVAEIAAVRYPERVQGLVLTNAVCYDSWPIPSVKFLRAISPLLSRFPSAFVYLIMGVLCVRGHDNPDRMQESLELHWRPYLRYGAGRALARQIEALDVRDTLAISGQLKHLDLPVAVVWGAADSFQKIGYGRRLAQDLRASLDPIPGGKHFVPEDHPSRIADAIETVTARVRAVS